MGLKTSEQETWDRVSALFERATSLTAQERAPWLAKLDVTDPTAAAEVRSLLKSAATSDFLEHAAPLSPDVSSAPMHPTRPSGERIGAWELEGLIGRGGMGDVYAAHRADGAYSQKVAIKFLRPEAGSHWERFAREQHILARLEHPGIARLLDGGITPDRHPFMVMEYVEGASLLEHCRETHADLHERLRLFVEVCDAVAYAHANLVIHRDLKPGNVRVTASSRVKLLDFGVAKLVSAETGGETTGMAPFTPDYAAPEQLGGQPVTIATDVYALGVMLFELLTETRPWSRDTTPLAAALKRLTETAPTSLSAQAFRHPNPPVSGKLLAGDLDAIVAKALRPEPKARYATVVDLKADIARYQNHEPVAAREGARLYVFGRMLRRYRWVAAGLVVVLFSLIGGIIGVGYEAKQARAAAASAQAVNDFLNQDLLAAANPQNGPNKDLTVKEVLDRSAQTVDQRFADRPEIALQVHQALAKSYYALNFIDEEEKQYKLGSALAQKLYGRSFTGDVAFDLIALSHDFFTSPATRIAKARELADDYQEHYGPEDPRTLKMGGYTAMAEAFSGDESYISGAQIASIRSLLGRALRQTPPDPETLTAIQGALIYTLQFAAEYKAGEAAAREAIAARLPVFGPNDYIVNVASCYLGEMLAQQGRLAEAEPVLVHAYEVVRRDRPERDMSVLRCEGSLGFLRMEQGKLDEAIAVFQDQIRNNPTHGGGLEARFDYLGDAYARSHQWKDAIGAYEARAKDLLDHHIPAEAEFVIYARVGITDVERQEGRYEDAESTLGLISPAGAAHLPSRHPTLGLLRRVQGLLYLHDGKRAEARAALKEAEDIFEARVGPDHWLTRRARQELASVPPA